MSSANVGQAGDTAILFGLSGTGKTTLSADPLRKELAVRFRESFKQLEAEAPADVKAAGPQG